MPDTLDFRPLALFDRDGVLNRDTGYPHKPEHIEWIDGALAALSLVCKKGYRTVIVTNQSGVGRGFYSEEDVEALHNWMAGEILHAGGRVDAFYFCPFHPHALIERYRSDHDDRKPRAGMLLKALARFPTDREASFLIGDKQSDLEAAARAGLTGHLFTGGRLDLFVGNILSSINGRAALVDRPAGDQIDKRT